MDTETCHCVLGAVNEFSRNVRLFMIENKRELELNEVDLHKISNVASYLLAIIGIANRITNLHTKDHEFEFNLAKISIQKYLRKIKIESRNVGCGNYLKSDINALNVGENYLERGAWNHPTYGFNVSV